jgi:DNA-binding transcriptional LysR family regulator
MVACEKLMIEGRAHFLLCHDHPAAPTRLTPDSFRSIEIGRDALAPVAKPDLLEACEPDSLPYLAYTPNPNRAASWPAAWASAGQHPPGEPAFSSHLASVLTAMARDGRGMCWSPLSPVADDIAAGRLARVENVAAEVPMGIRLFRPKARRSRAAETLWERTVNLVRKG